MAAPTWSASAPATSRWPAAVRGHGHHREQQHQGRIGAGETAPEDSQHGGQRRWDHQRSGQCQTIAVAPSGQPSGRLY
jgi:hypothetical protein